MFEYSISGSEYDSASILYSPSINVSYFDNDTEKVDIKNLKNIYERKLKKVINNRAYSYSNCSSIITYFDNKILCIEDWLIASENEDYYYSYNIISSETGRKLNNTLEDLVDYDEKFIEFLKKEYKEHIKSIRDYLSIAKRTYLWSSHSDEPKQSDDFYFPDDFDFQNDSDLTEQSDNLSEESLDLPEPPRQSKFIFEFKNDELYLSIYYYWFSTDANYNNSYLPLPIEMKKLKPYIKKDSFYRYLFD